HAPGYQFLVVGCFLILPAAPVTGGRAAAASERRLQAGGPPRCKFPAAGGSGAWNLFPPRPGAHQRRTSHSIVSGWKRCSRSAAPFALSSGAISASLSRISA